MSRAAPVLRSARITTPWKRALPLAGLKGVGHAVDEALQYYILAHTDNRIVGTGHAQIGDVGGAGLENMAVRGLHVGVGSHHRGNPPGQILPMARFSEVARLWKIHQANLHIGEG